MYAHQRRSEGGGGLGLQPLQPLPFFVQKYKDELEHRSIVILEIKRWKKKWDSQCHWCSSICIAETFAVCLCNLGHLTSNYGNSWMILQYTSAPEELLTFHNVRWALEWSSTSICSQWARHLVCGHLADGQLFAEGTTRRRDISPTRNPADGTYRRWDISPTVQHADETTCRRDNLPTGQLADQTGKLADGTTRRRNYSPTGLLRE